MAEYLEEHKAPPEFGNPDSQEQDHEELEIVQMVEELFIKAKRAKEPFSKDWQDYYNYMNGKQWKNPRPSYRHSEVINLIHAAIQVIVPILTDNRPNIEVQPMEPGDYEFSEILTQLLRAKWDQKGWAEQVAWAIMDACVYGTAIGSVLYDPKAANGLGDIDFKIEDPFQIFPDPAAWDINDGTCKYLIQAIPTSISELKRQFPEKADLISAEIISVESSKKLHAELIDLKVQNPADNRVQIVGSGSGNYEDDDKALKLVCWLFDESVEDYEIEHEDDVEHQESDSEDDGQPMPMEESPKTEQMTRKKYPRGRKIIVANGVLLYDSDPETGFGYLDYRIPMAKLVDHIMPREFWGQGEVKQLMGPQMMYNKIISYMLDVLVITGNPVWIVSSDSGVYPENIINAPGAVIEKNPGSEVRREDGASLPGYLLSMAQLVKEQFDEVSGINAVSKGLTPNNTSGIAVQQLQEASQTKLRLKARNMEKFLKQVGSMMVSRILQFYSLPRIERITGKQGVEQYFKFSVDSITDESGQVQQYVANVQQLQTDEFGNVIESSPQQYQIKGDFDVVVNTGSELPFRRAEREAKALQLLQLGIIDVEEYLNEIKWPNKEKTIVKYQERQAAQAQAAAAQPPQGA